jgi:hypothetical protein
VCSANIVTPEHRGTHIGHLVNLIEERSLISPIVVVTTTHDTQVFTMMDNDRIDTGRVSSVDGYVPDSPGYAAPIAGAHRYRLCAVRALA